MRSDSRLLTNNQKEDQGLNPTLIWICALTDKIFDPKKEKIEVLILL